MWDVGTAIATDSLGRVYVTGASETNAYEWEVMGIATVAYDSDGTKLWAARHQGCAFHFDSGTAIATDSLADVVYVTGHSWYPGGRFYITLAYDASTGTELWDAVYGGKATDIAVDSLGNVYVTGTRGDYFNSDYGTVAYDKSGTTLWHREYNGLGNGKDVANAIALDSQDNVYVTGTSEGIGTLADYATVANDSAGNQLWARRYDGPGNDRDEAYAITTDSAGNVHVTGLNMNSGACTTLAYNPNGDQIGIAVYENTDEFWSNGGDAIAADSAGNVYVTGESQFYDAAGFDAVTIKYRYLNTPPGQHVATQPNDPNTGEAPAIITFDEVTTGGETTLAVNENGDPPDTGFKLGDPPCYYEIETTAMYSGFISICIDYTGASFTDEQNLSLFHQESGGEWVDITTSLDTENNIICGEVTSLSTFTVFESMLEVDIDIKPGSDPNSINRGSNGNVPVAIFSTADFDATSVDPLSITLAGAEVKIKGKGDPMAKFEDINGDGLIDIIIHVDTRALELSPGDTDAILEGKTHDGILIYGTDTVRIVRD